MADENKVTYEGKKYKIIVDRSLCIGAASCVAVGANTFALDDKNIAVVTNPNGDDDDTVLAAAQSCPVDAIILIDKATGDQIWPKI